MTGKQKQSVRNMRRAGFSCGAIADRLGLPVNTVKSYCFRKNIRAPEDTGDKNDDACEHCGKPLEHRSGKKKKRFCCDKCRWNWWNRNRGRAGGKKTHRPTSEITGFGGEKRKHRERDRRMRIRREEESP
jgi:transposase-like protein